MEKKKNREMGRREFLQKGSMAALSVPLITGFKPSVLQNFSEKATQSIIPEWRNKQAGMVYRQLGRTGSYGFRVSLWIMR